MSIIDPVPPDVLRATYTHQGWLGLCPVWFNININSNLVTERNGVPEWFLLLNLHAQSLAAQCIEAIGGEAAPGWAIRITGRL